jgi:heme exporter protein D
MIDGGWGYIWSAYALALGTLLVLAIVVLARLAHWSKRAKELEKRP